MQEKKSTAQQLHKNEERSDDLSFAQIQSDSIQLIVNASCCLHACYVYLADMLIQTTEVNCARHSFVLAIRF